jgi:hypothetical protein
VRQQRLFLVAFGVFACAAAASIARPAHAQNDWQYPDPYFGILEIEKSHDRATTRRYREEVNPAPRSSRYAAPSAWQAPAGDAAGTATATPSATPTAAMPAPVTRPRWRNRWRR